MGSNTWEELHVGLSQMLNEMETPVGNTEDLMEGLRLDQEVEVYLEELRALRQPTAKAMSEYEYAKEWTKVTKAKLIEAYLEHNPRWSHARAETAALADEAYLATLVARKQAQEAALSYQWAMRQKEMFLELWRTSQATKRVEMKAYS